MPRLWALVLVAAACAACVPLRVDISEQAIGGFVAAARGKDAAECAEARRRVTEEARYFCDVRGRQANLGNPRQTGDAPGCRVELLFSCGGGAF